MVGAALCAAPGCSKTVEGGVPLPIPDPVQVRILSPAEGSIVGGVRILVAGEVAPTSLTSVLINGLSAPAESGEFAAWIDVEDGLNTVTVVHPESGASSAVSFTVDTLPPRLEIVSPARGTFSHEAASVALTLSAQDESGIARVEAAGQLLDAAAGPQWTTQATLGVGVNTLIVEVEDALGNVATEHVNVLNGAFQPPQDGLTDAVVVHMGPDALRAFESVAGTLVDKLDYTGLAAGLNPLLDTSLATVTVDKVSLLPNTEVGFVAGKGTLGLTLVLYGLSAEAQVAALGVDWDAALTIEQTTITVPIEINTVDGAFDAALQEPTFEFTTPEVTVSDGGGGETGSAVVEGPVLESLEKLLTKTVLKHGIQMLDNALLKLTTPFSYTIAGFEATVQLSALAAEVGDHGVELRLSGTLSVDGEVVTPPQDDPGVFRTADTTVYRPRSSLLTLALSDDLVNTAGHAVWRLGGLNQVIDQTVVAGVKSKYELIAGFLVGLTDPKGLGVDSNAAVTVGFDAPLPPVLSGVPGTDAVGLVIGDLALEFRVDGQPRVTGFVTAGFSGAALTQDGSLSLQVDTSRTVFDLSVGDPEIERKIETTFEPIVKHLFEELGPLWDELVGTVPVPQIGAFRPVNVSVGVDGTHGAYLVLRGSLIEAEAD